MKGLPLYVYAVLLLTTCSSGYQLLKDRSWKPPKFLGQVGGHFVDMGEECTPKRERILTPKRLITIKVSGIGVAEGRHFDDEVQSLWVFHRGSRVWGASSYDSHNKILYKRPIQGRQVSSSCDSSFVIDTDASLRVCCVEAGSKRWSSYADVGGRILLHATWSHRGPRGQPLAHWCGPSPDLQGVAVYLIYCHFYERQQPTNHCTIQFSSDGVLLLALGDYMKPGWSSALHDHDALHDMALTQPHYTHNKQAVTTIISANQRMWQWRGTAPSS